jgi:hypothetical protein
MGKKKNKTLDEPAGNEGDEQYDMREVLGLKPEELKKSKLGKARTKHGEKQKLMDPKKEYRKIRESMPHKNLKNKFQKHASSWQIK